EEQPKREASQASVAVAIAAGTVAGKVCLENSEQSTGEAARAESILQNAGFNQPAHESVLIQNAHENAGAPAFAGCRSRSGAARSPEASVGKRGPRPPVLRSPSEP